MLKIYVHANFQIFMNDYEIVIFSLTKKEIERLTVTARGRLLCDDTPKKNVLNFDLITAVRIAKDYAFMMSIPWTISPHASHTISEYQSEARNYNKGYGNKRCNFSLSLYKTIQQDKSK